MTSESVTDLRTVLAQIEASAARATTRAEMVNLRALWSSVKRILDNEEAAR